MTFSVDPGMSAEWVNAGAAVAAALFGAAALVVAIFANMTAKAARTDAQEAVERAQAGSVAAWWAADREAEGRRYGVVISNQSTINAVFHNVVVTTTQDLKVNARVEIGETPQKAPVAYEIRLNVLLPGQFFVQNRHSPRETPMPCRSDTTDKAWGSDGQGSLWHLVPLPVLPGEILDPFTVARDRSIESITYDDALGIRWQWTPAGLTKTTPATPGR